MDITTKMLIKTTREAAYEAFINPEKMKYFWFDISEKFKENCILTLGERSMDVTFQIETGQLIKDAYIEFFWPAHHDDKKKVTIELTDQSDQVLITVIEHDLSEENMERLIFEKEGFVYMLSCLKVYLETGYSIKGGLVI